MTLIGELLQWPIVQFISFIGIGLFLDSILPKAAKSALAKHLSVKGFSDQKEFASLLISNLIELFLKKDGSISLIRIIIFEIILINFLVILIDSIFNPESSKLVSDDFAKIFIYSILPATILDYFSLYISKKIFYYQYIPVRYILFAWVLDVMISCVPYVLVLAPYPYEKLFQQPENGYTFVLIAVVVSIFTSVLLNLIQIAAIIGGFFVKALSFIDVAYDNGLERAANQPLTLVFGLVGVMFVIFEFALPIFLE